MKKALLVLTLAISSTGLKAEESQVPFKVGDIVRLTPPAFGSKNEKPCDSIFEVKDIKGKWVSHCTHHWVNSDLYLYISVNDPAIVKLVKEGIPPEGWTRPPIFHTNPVTKPTAPQKPGEVEEPKAEEESK